MEPIFAAEFVPFFIPEKIQSFPGKVPSSVLVALRKNRLIQRFTDLFKKS